MMECGKTILVNMRSVKVRSSWGTYRCPDCWIALAEEASAEAESEEDE